MTVTETEALRAHLVKALEGRQAHVDLETTLAKIAFEDLGQRPKGASYTLWEVLEHLRLAQWDIVEFSKSPGHVSPEYPEGYWPESRAPEDEAEWRQCRDAILADLEAMKALVSDAGVDLFAAIPNGEGQTVLREAMLVADHNAYHLGQIVLMMKMLGRW